MPAHVPLAGVSTLRALRPTCRMAAAAAAGAAFQTRTEIEVQAVPLQKQLSYGDGICLLGSCFSENMASRCDSVIDLLL
jgi:hypothetical protein